MLSPGKPPVSVIFFRTGGNEADMELRFNPAFHPEAFPLDQDRLGVMQEAIEDGGS
jgi:hypothetical protein